MLKAELNTYDTNNDPASCFATDAEIEVAEQLRHRIEERYLARSSAPLPLPSHSSEVH
jgi:hypothetical protein